jgi:xanthine dehydrogenase YagT iron-sulfur-binding subunit
VIKLCTNRRFFMGLAVMTQYRWTRRNLLHAGAVAGGAAAGGLAAADAFSPVGVPQVHLVHDPEAAVPVRLRVNGTEYSLDLDARVTLLDALREHLQLTGSKKGCDHGQCGACTVLLNGRRINACLTLAVMLEGDDITTVEGLAAGRELHPLQAAFIAHDGLQCGYCTPGQLCSAVGMLAEADAGWPSHVTDDVANSPLLTDGEIAERMSGNLCRCSAYPNIVAAIGSVAGRRPR